MIVVVITVVAMLQLLLLLFSLLSLLLLLLSQHLLYFQNKFIILFYTISACLRDFVQKSAANLLALL